MTKKTKLSAKKVGADMRRPARRSPLREYSVVYCAERAPRHEHEEPDYCHLAEIEVEAPDLWHAVTAAREYIAEAGWGSIDVRRVYPILPNQDKVTNA